MREIDPIRNPSDALLSSALHRLASGANREAPAQLGQDLAAAFRRHHRRRRQVRMAFAASLAACLALAAILLMPRSPAVNNQHDPKSPEAAQQARPGIAPPQAAAIQPLSSSAALQQHKAARVTQSPAESNGFIPLPSYDPSMSTDELQIVRLEVSSEDLRLVGAPVADDVSDRQLLADIVVGRDGTPYAVRLVR